MYWPKKQRGGSDRFGLNAVDEVRAVVLVEEAAYKQFARHGQVGQVLSWADYCAFVEKCIQKGVDSGWAVKVYEADNVGISAFLYSTGLDFNTRTLLIYAADLLRVENGQDSVVHRR